MKHNVKQQNRDYSQLIYLNIAEVEEQKKAAVYVPPSKRGIVGSGVPVPLKAGPQWTQPKQVSSQLSENEKKARTIKKKLEQIEKIKQLVKDGGKVEKNQEEKLKTESELLEQLAELGIE